MGDYLTLKQKKFIASYLETGNATEAAMRAYKPKNRATARAIGSENLTKPSIRAYLEKRISAMGISEKEIAEIHRRNLEQAENISASNAALDMYYKLRGDYAPEKRMNLNVNLSTDERSARKKEIVLELRRLGALDNVLLDEVRATPIEARV